MRLIKLALFGDHLGLHPDAEGEAESAHFVGEGGDAARLFFVVEPIAEGGGVVVAAAEPAVVEDEELGARLLCRPCDVQDALAREGEVGALPIIDEHGAGFLLPDAADDVLLHKGAHPEPHLALAVAEAEHRFGRKEGLSPFELPRKGEGIDARKETGAAHVVALRNGAVIARIDEVDPHRHARTGEQREGRAEGRGGAREGGVLALAAV